MAWFNFFLPTAPLALPSIPENDTFAQTRLPKLTLPRALALEENQAISFYQDGKRSPLFTAEDDAISKTDLAPLSPRRDITLIIFAAQKAVVGTWQANYAPSQEQTPIALRGQFFLSLSNVDKFASALLAFPPETNTSAEILATCVVAELQRQNVPIDDILTRAESLSTFLLRIMAMRLQHLGLSLTDFTIQGRKPEDAAPPEQLNLELAKKPAAAPETASDEEAIYYYLANAQQMGPFSAQKIRYELAAGKITPQQLIWKQGMKAWTPLRNCPEFSADCP